MLSEWKSMRKQSRRKETNIFSGDVIFHERVAAAEYRDQLSLMITWTADPLTPLHRQLQTPVPVPCMASQTLATAPY